MGTSQHQRPNLLFVSLEDLNDYVEPLGGHPQVKTPNITRLAARGALFPNTFAAAPACAPARAAVLFGRMPWRTGLYTNKQQWFHAFKPGQDRSLIGVLRDSGFTTWGSGKMFYGGVNDAEWTNYFREPNDPYTRQSVLQQTGQIKAGMIDYGPALSEGPLYDERNATHLKNKMTRGASGQVWSLGIYRPHLPFIAPQRFFDLYPETVEPAPALKERLFDPFSSNEIEGLPREPRNRIVGAGMFGKKLYENQQYNSFLRAYLASISYADWVLGSVLDHLEAEGLTETTYIVLWSDHGYQFGEKNTFHKFSLWERSLRTPMIFAGPDIPTMRIETPVSNVDVGPTLLGLLGVARPQAFVDGQDLRPLFQKMETSALPPVVSCYGFPRVKPPAENGELLLAFSVRSATHRLVTYWNGGLELYDHTIDPYEQRNLANGPKYRSVPQDLNDIAHELASYIPQDPAATATPKKVPKKVPDGEGPFPHWVSSIG
ncbi:sulfatase-like hydrolase/transferase [Shimia sp.]|uniref:sulfatase-like hydrolase/transferase n=1 Tax=Shimia sp. TaxID=1954381 RepID=UPI003299D0BD